MTVPDVAGLLLTGVLLVAGISCTVVTFMQWLLVRKKRDRSLKRYLRPILRTLVFFYWNWGVEVLVCWEVIPPTDLEAVLVSVPRDLITISLPTTLVLVSLILLSALSPSGDFNYVPLALWTLANVSAVITLDVLTVTLNLSWLQGILFLWILVSMWAAVAVSWRKVWAVWHLFKARDDTVFAPGEIVLRRYYHFLLATTAVAAVCSVPWVYFGYHWLSDLSLHYSHTKADLSNVVFCALQGLVLLGVSLWMAPSRSDDLTEAYEPLVPP